MVYYVYKTNDFCTNHDWFDIKQLAVIKQMYLMSNYIKKVCY